MSPADRTKSSPSTSIIFNPLGRRSRRGSFASLSSTGQVDREALSQALDHIHTSASQSDTLTTFNEFAEPPPATALDAKGLTADLVPSGLTGLYTRFRGAVGASSNGAVTPDAAETDADSVDLSAKPAKKIPSTSRTSTNVTADHLEADEPKYSRNSSNTTASAASKAPVAPFSKATPSAVANPTLAPVNVIAWRDEDKRSRSRKNSDAVSREDSSGSGAKPRASRKMETSAASTGPVHDQDRSADLPAASHPLHLSKTAHPVADEPPVTPERVKVADATPRAIAGNHDRETDPVKDTERDTPARQRKKRLREARERDDEVDSATSIRSASTGNHTDRPRGPRRPPSNALIPEEGHDDTSTAVQELKSRILSKDFWMRDENCKECFDCGLAFSTWRRKHHCRICGQIFDARCTSLISGERFGLAGTLRVCKRCTRIIDEVYAGSDESDAATTISSMRLPSAHPITHHATVAEDMLQPRRPDESDDGTPRRLSFIDEARPASTPMMAIPATRRAGGSSGRRSAVLEIDAEDSGSRPGSSKSVKTSFGGRVSANAGAHRRHRTRHQHARSIRTIQEDKAPFHRNPTDDSEAGTRLPAFHNDSIIDPDLAPYMSDEGSSADEQANIFATMNDESRNFPQDKSSIGGLLAAARKQRARLGEKSGSMASVMGREADDISVGSHKAVPARRPSRRRTTVTDPLASPSIASAGQSPPKTGGPRMTRMTRSASMTGAVAPAVELNKASLQHVHKLLRQLLHDADIPNVDAWERALVPILLQCTDDVNPDVRHGDDMDIRHYVKVKRIPGGRPSDTAYLSGVVFSKNLALKSMRRSISQPRIVIITFPLEFQRHQPHFMSLEPIIAQEKEYLRNMVNRIVALKPQLLLVQRNVSGLALQYLAEANVATIYNVKLAVLEAVSRCAQTDIINSMDMLLLKPVNVGRSAAFDLKTVVHRQLAAGKKSYVYISGCPPDLGCTIVLRGASLEALAKLKRIAEFMVYVVYNLKLETSLMRDEFVLIPSSAPTTVAGDDTSRAVRSGGVTRSQAHALDANAKRVEAPPRDAATVIATAAAPSPVTNHIETTRSAADVTNADVRDTASQEPGSVPAAAEKDRAKITHMDSVPEDVPMPTFYTDMVEKHETKILSASPFVKFMQPYLLMRAREQERRLAYLKRLRDQDRVLSAADDEKGLPQDFQLITPEMVHETVQDAPRKVMEVLHAVHDAEYDKALYNYETQKRQWEAYIAGNINLFDPFAHQNIVVLYTVVCTATAIPCAGPDLRAWGFYNELDPEEDFDSDCTLGQYVEDLCLGADGTCSVHGCDKGMFEHHRSYVHGEARITVFTEKSPCKLRGLQDTILMWSYCKVCQKETQVMPMSENTWKYSFGKYLELSFWSSDLRLRASFCPHDLHRDYLRYFGYKDVALRVHYDPIDLLEIIVPRARITWKVELDLQLKNDLFDRARDRIDRFMNSVSGRIGGISAESVAPDKAEACRAEIERLRQRAEQDHGHLRQDLQDTYMSSRYYEVIPMNRVVRALQEKVVEWGAAFADFDADFFPSEKDISRLATLQLKRLFLDREDSLAPSLEESPAGAPSEAEEPESTAAGTGALELTPKPTEVSRDIAHDVLTAVIEQEATQPPTPNVSGDPPSGDGTTDGSARVSISHLDLAVAAETSRPASPGDTRERGTAADAKSVLPTLSDHKGPGAGLVSLTRGSSIPRPTEEVRRKATAEPSSAQVRAKSQPAHLRRLPSSQHARNGAPPKSEEAAKGVMDHLPELAAVSALKGGKKSSGHSFIPRSIPSRRHESRVTALAKHFEQLSREFEKERQQERRLRAATSRQSRATPMASSKPVVEVYRNALEAVDEREPSDDETTTEGRVRTSTETSQTGGSSLTEGVVTSSGSQVTVDPSISTESTSAHPTPEGGATSASQTASEGEVETEEVDVPLLETKDGSQPIDLKLDLPKHERSSLMDMLSNFWAERSASGWAPLEYPLSASDHVFLDSDVIVREDEPSSLIAFTLSSGDYKTKLASIQQKDSRLSEGGGVGANGHGVNTAGHGRSLPPHQHEFDSDEQVAVERSLLRPTGTHLKYQFQEGSAKMLCKVFYAEQFDAVRRKCGVADRVVESLSRCVKWDSKGGKSRSVFLKTLDQRLLLKSLSAVETQAFLKFAPAYFQIMSEALFHELPTVIAKMLGFYQIILKNPVTGLELKWDVLVMENLFYDRVPTRIFDLKGSMRGRKIESTGEQNEVLLDENMVEFIYESPLFAREHSKNLLRASVWNDTLFLARQNVMDYSLMIAIDEVRKELVVGIIDCIRTYTWDKKLESWIKDRGFAGGGRNKPTVTSPKEYKSRFREAMARYVLQAPNCWHQFVAQPLQKRPLESASSTTTRPSTSLSASLTAASVNTTAPTISTTATTSSTSAVPSLVPTTPVEKAEGGSSAAITEPTEPNNPEKDKGKGKEKEKEKEKEEDTNNDQDEDKGKGKEKQKGKDKDKKGKKGERRRWFVNV
ncbi:MAG: 1-phosphatidylinositol-3-phosphate 5-kinase [Thelocarpon superellum]|nr:MAG: 1-phosphatidylinositol-3-phosphate 5-kinase [Thelocarpon superellum]